MSLRFEWVRSLQGVAFPVDAYKRLHESVHSATPFNRPGWLYGAEHALAAGQGLHVLLGWEDEQLVLCLPLVAGRERMLGLPMSVIRHLGYPLADRIALMVLPSCAKAAMAQASREIARTLPHGLLQLSEIIDPPERFSAWARASWRTHAMVSCRVPEHLLVEADHKPVSGQVGNKIRRFQKRCHEAGALVRRVVANAGNIDELLSAMSDVEKISWKGDEGVGIFSGVQRKQWLYESLRGLAVEGCVRLVMLELEGRCISYRLGLLERGRLYDYNIAFLPQYAELGSGRVLLDEWIRWGLEEHWHWVDASRVSLARSSHQLHERMSGQVVHTRWSFYSQRPCGRLLGTADQLWQWLKPRIKAWRELRVTKLSSEGST